MRSLVVVGENRAVVISYFQQVFDRSVCAMKDPKTMPSTQRDFRPMPLCRAMHFGSATTASARWRCFNHEQDGDGEVLAHPGPKRRSIRRVGLPQGCRRLVCEPCSRVLWGRAHMIAGSEMHRSKSPPDRKRRTFAMLASALAGSVTKGIRRRCDPARRPCRLPPLATVAGQRTRRTPASIGMPLVPHRASSTDD
jgi:hypothetical protein